MEIIQIVPELPPAINGLGDQAYLLAKELKREYGIETKFIVGNATQGGRIDGFSITAMEQRTALALDDVLNEFCPSDGVVILHYVGYGYARRGCPFWLLDGLKKWRGGMQGRRLITMFYEVYASGAPWRSSFWTSPFQRSIAANLACLSDACRTNMRRYARILGKIAGRTDVSVMPVFSNVGDATDIKPYDERKRRMVVFGGETWRAKVYEEHRNELLAAFRMLDLEELVDVGPPTAVNFQLPVPFRQCGTISAAEISAILSDARVGVLGYPPAFLGKSTIFAAYAAHGLAPVLLADTSCTSEDDLEEGRDYVTSQFLDSCRMNEISSAAYCWYKRHDLATTAQAYAKVIAGANG